MVRYWNSCDGRRAVTPWTAQARIKLRITSLAILVVLGMMLDRGFGQSPAPDNLDFRRGTLEGWEGSGFYLTAGQSSAPGAAFGVCSSDAGSPTRKGMLRYVLTVPPGAEVLVCQDRKSTRLDSSHTVISYAVFCLKKKKLQMY